jgi:hypothetical protein
VNHSPDFLIEHDNNGMIWYRVRTTVERPPPARESTATMMPMFGEVIHMIRDDDQGSDESDDFSYVFNDG